MFDGFDGSAHHIEKDLESTREIGFNEIKSDLIGIQITIKT